MPRLAAANRESLTFGEGDRIHAFDIGESRTPILGRGHGSIMESDSEKTHTPLTQCPELLMAEVQALRQRICALEAERTGLLQAQRLLELQRNLATALGATTGLHRSLEILLDAVLQVELFDCGGVYVINREADCAELIVHRGLSAPFVQRVSRFERGSESRNVMDDGVPVYLRASDLVLEMRDVHLREGLRAIAVVPVKSKGQVIADLNLASHIHDEIPLTVRLALESVAAQIGGIVARTWAEEDLNASYEALQKAHELLERRVEERTLELKGALGEIKRSERRLARAQRTAKIGTWEWNAADGTVAFSEEMYRILGVSAEEFTPSFEEFLVLVHPDDRERLSFAGPETERVLECRIFDQKTREVKHVQVWSELLRDAQGNLLGVAGTLQDITRRKQMEEANLALERKMLQSQKVESIGVLAGGIAHDFNNLLMGILGPADMVLDHTEDNAPTVAYLLTIKTAARRLADLTQQILTYAGKGRLRVEPISLNRIVEDMSSLLAVSFSKNAEIHCDLSPALPPAAVDAAQMGQVILNLVTNAAESLADRSGMIHIRTGVLQTGRRNQSNLVLGEVSSEGQYVYIEVADTGCGMTGQMMTKIFDPFFSTKFAGRGLGLAVVHGIVRGHHGAIEVQTEVGKGSSFRVILPMAQAG